MGQLEWIPRELLLHILEYLITAIECDLFIASYVDDSSLCKLQQCNKFFYFWTKDVDDLLWKNRLLGAKLYLDHQLSLKLSNSNLLWQDLIAYKRRVRICRTCKSKFRESDNSSRSCNFHPGKRELLDDVIGGPSGVYWSCCQVRSMDSIGCSRQFHMVYNVDLRFNSDRWIKVILV